jgi:hypothetical protein
VNGLNITISDATTGEILRDLTLDTTHRYQPQTTAIRANPEGSPCPRCLETSHVCPEGDLNPHAR